jgi:hypothetical protein
MTERDEDAAAHDDMQTNSAALIAVLSKLFRNTAGNRESINLSLQQSFDDGALGDIEFDDCRTETASINDFDEFHSIAESPDTDDDDAAAAESTLQSSWHKAAKVSQDLVAAQIDDNSIDQAKANAILAKVFGIVSKKIICSEIISETD